MRNRFQRFVGLGALLVYGLMAGWNYITFDIKAERRKARSPEINPVPRPEIVAPLAMGMDAMVADLYWIVGVNYFGSELNEQYCYAQLSDYMRLVTRLAPEFESAYRFAGVSIPCSLGDKWLYVNEANSFLREGVKRFPANYQMRLTLAYYLSAMDHNFEEAAQQLEASTKIPGCPDYVRLLLTRMYTTAGNLDKAESVAAELIEQAPNDSVKEALLKRQAELETFRILKQLNALREQYEKEFGKHLGSIEDLLKSGKLKEVPPEPLDGEFQYDAEANEIVSTKLHDRLVLFERK